MLFRSRQLLCSAARSLVFGIAALSFTACAPTGPTGSDTGSGGSGGSSSGSAGGGGSAAPGSGGGSGANATGGKIGRDEQSELACLKIIEDLHALGLAEHVAKFADYLD